MQIVYSWKEKWWGQKDGFLLTVTEGNGLMAKRVRGV